MKTAKILSAPVVVREREAQRINAHALGVTLSAPPEDDMKRFEVIEKERLVEQHAADLASLNAEIDQWKQRTAGLEQQIRRLGTRENRLMLAVGALAMVVAYFYVRDLGCGAPLWSRMWGV